MLAAGLAVGGTALFNALKRGRGPDVPTAAVTRGDFVEIVETRGDIRPFRSIVVTAPFQAGDLQILKLATNGAAVRRGDVVADFEAVTLPTRRTNSRSFGSAGRLDQATEQTKSMPEEDRTEPTGEFDVGATIDVGDPSCGGGRSRAYQAGAHHTEQRLREAETKNAPTRPRRRQTCDTTTQIEKIQADIDPRTAACARSR